MVVKITLRNGVSKEHFLSYTKLWNDNLNVKIDYQVNDIETKKKLLNLALDRIPDSFSEAIIDLLLEDINFIVDETNLMKCVEKGSIGLKRSIYYRSSTPEYIRNLCDS